MSIFLQKWKRVLECSSKIRESGTAALICF
jgi:hypothetical protein